MPTADAPASTDFIRSIVALLRHPQRDPAQLREAMLGSPETARLAFGALLEGRRMAVHPDADRVFRVEGLWGLKVSTRTEQAPTCEPVVSGSGRNPPMLTWCNFPLAVTLMKKLRRRFSRSKPVPRRNAFVERDTDYVSVFERGLALDGTPELGRRERFWLLVQLYRSTFGLAGETLEAGCLFGLSSFLMCHAARLRDPSFTGKGHSLVDSFRGFAEPQEADFGPQSHRMIHGLKDRPKFVDKGWRARTERTLSEFPGVTFHEGWIPEIFETLPETRYRFVHVDVDLHDPTRDCLEYFYPRLVETGVLVIDDYGFPSWPGCKVATDAFAAKHGVPIVQLPTGNAFLIRRSPA